MFIQNVTSIPFEIWKIDLKFPTRQLWQVAILRILTEIFCEHLFIARKFFGEKMFWSVFLFSNQWFYSYSILLRNGQSVMSTSNHGIRSEFKSVSTRLTKQKSFHKVLILISTNSFLFETTMFSENQMWSPCIAMKISKWMSFILLLEMILGVGVMKCIWTHWWKFVASPKVVSEMNPFCFTPLKTLHLF